MPKWTVGVIAAVFALLIGFACGAMLTKPDVVRTETAIKESQAHQQKMLKEQEQLKIDQRQLEVPDDDN